MRDRISLQNRCVKVTLSSALMELPVRETCVDFTACRRSPETQRERGKTVETEVERERCKLRAHFSIPGQAEWSKLRSGDRYSILRVGRPGDLPEVVFHCGCWEDECLSEIPGTKALRVHKIFISVASNSSVKIPPGAAHSSNREMARADGKKKKVKIQYYLYIYLQAHTYKKSNKQTPS